MMMNKRCLYCYEPLEQGDFHEKCSQLFFGSPVPPLLDMHKDQIEGLAKDVVLRSVAVTGVQPKLSLTIEPVEGDPKTHRFTIVGLWGNYILKPPAAKYPFLPENEDLTMKICSSLGIPTAMHSLIRLQSGELAYITKRFDREGTGKLAMEDFCQLTETLTSNKYLSTMEKAARCITRFSTRPGLDAINFFELALASFITGNADMHLKNFSLITTPKYGTSLSPAYDLVCTKMVIPEDPDEIALTINAGIMKLSRKDFDSLAANMGMTEKSMQNSYQKIASRIGKALQLVDISFLPDDLKVQYKEIIADRAVRLY